jgi:hypothetical protein
MGRRVGPDSRITFYSRGFKLVMARIEVRKDNGDLEVPPQLYRRVPRGWELLDWSNLPDDRAILGLLKRMKARRYEACPCFRNPVPPHDPFFDAWPI